MIYKYACLFIDHCGGLQINNMIYDIRRIFNTNSIPPLLQFESLCCLCHL